MATLVEGAIFDADGPRAGYAVLERGRVLEVGQRGTDSTRGRAKRIRGIVVPAPVNAHTHLGDAVSVREPPAVSFSELVAPPSGFKFRLLAGAGTREKREGMHRALERMREEGIAGAIDFREEGLAGVRRLREAGRGTGVRVVALGRPIASPRRRSEVEAILNVADGIGLSSAREESRATREMVARACRARRKLYALHASEELREPLDTFLSPRPDLVVHLTCASIDDLAAVRDANVFIAVCPRSNALFRRRPRLAEMERLGASVVLGTDNAMLQAPSIFRELEYAYVSSRQVGRPVSADFLARAAFVEPWRFLGEPARAEVRAGSPARAIAFRLPPEDPAYQLVTRATEHLMIHPERRAPAARERA